MAGSAYKNMSIDVPALAFKHQSRGHISEEEMGSLEDFANLLNKTAGISDYFGEGTMGRRLGMGLAEGAGLAAAGLGVGAAGHGLAKAHSKLTFRRDLNQILDVHPDLKDYSHRDINLAYQSIRTLNPQVARDPLVGGTLLGQILRNRDINDPTKVPRFDLGVAKELADMSGKMQARTPRTDAAQKAIQGRLESALKGDDSRGGAGGGGGGGGSGGSGGPNHGSYGFRRRIFARGGMA